MLEKRNWRNCEMVENKMSNFHVIWENVTSFSYLHRVVSKKWKELDQDIKKWKK
jgi:hypothetical protein